MNDNYLWLNASLRGLPDALNGAEIQIDDQGVAKSNKIIAELSNINWGNAGRNAIKEHARIRGVTCRSSHCVSIMKVPRCILCKPDGYLWIGTATNNGVKSTMLYATPQDWNNEGQVTFMKQVAAHIARTTAGSKNFSSVVGP